MSDIELQKGDTAIVEPHDDCYVNLGTIEILTPIVIATCLSCGRPVPLLTPDSLNE